MDRRSSHGSGSAGVRVGENHMIAFGDYPEPVDFLLARERVLRARDNGDGGVEKGGKDDRGKEGEGKENVGLGLGIEGMER